MRIVKADKSKGDVKATNGNGVSRESLSNGEPLPERNVSVEPLEPIPLSAEMFKKAMNHLTEIRRVRG